MQRDGHDSKGAENDGAFTQKNPVFTTLVIEGAIPFDGFLKSFFEAEGHYILRASTAPEALAMIRQHWPDLILLNKEMAGTDGLKFLPELLIEHPSAAIIVMADKSDVSEAVEAMTLGAADYLERPLDAQRLRQAIETQKALYKLL